MLRPVATDIEALKTLDERLRWLSAWTIHHANHHPRERRRAEGRRPSGELRVDDRDHGGALFPCARPATTGSRSSRMPDRCFTQSIICWANRPRGAGELPRLRRRAILSEPDQGQHPGRFLDRLGRPRRGDHAFASLVQDYLIAHGWLDEAGPRADGRADGRCRARRGQYLRSLIEGAKHDVRNLLVDRRLQPAEPRRDQRRPHVPALRRDFPKLRLAGASSLRYGKRLQAAFDEPGAALKGWFEQLPNADFGASLSGRRGLARRGSKRSSAGRRSSPQGA